MRKLRRAVPERMIEMHLARCVIQMITAAAVRFRGESFFESLGPSGFELLGRAVTPVGLSFLKKAVRMLAVQVQPIGLAKRTLIPVQAQPSHPFLDYLDRFLGRAGTV